MTDPYLAGGTAENRRGFGSDNHSGVHPSVLDAVVATNVGHAPAYGDDAWTVAADEVVASRFGAECTVALVFNGTGANVVGLSAVLDPWSSVLAPADAHINTDECGAVEHVLGGKIVPIPTDDGKLTPEAIAPFVAGLDNEHHREPRVVSISNLTELGTAYSPDEVRGLAEFAHANGMLLHMDGARIANAAAASGCELADLTGRAGVDVLSLGGTKNGMMGAEAVVLSERVERSRVRYLRKMNLQLASKQRFLAAQFIAMFGGDLWLECAGHANDLASMLAAGVQSAGCELAYRVDGNEVFAYLPHDTVADLQARFRFYTWREGAREGFDVVRWVCSFDTTSDDVDELIQAVRTALG